MKDYIELGNRVSWEDNNLVTKLLSLNKNLDVLHDNGSYFIRAIESNSYDIVNTLLEYFESNQLSKYEPRSYKYSSLKKKMYDIIELAIEDAELTKEMQKILTPYLPQKEEDYQLDLNDSLITENNLIPSYEHPERIQIGESYDYPDQIL